MALSDTKLRKINGKSGWDGEIKDRDGMSVRISPKGKITFQQRFRFNDVAVRMSLGVYSDDYTLADAREDTTKNKKLLKDGHDPRITKKLTKRKNISGPVTVKNGLMYWLDEYASKNRKDVDKLIRLFEMYVYPIIGTLVIDKTEKSDWLLIFKGMDKQPTQAGRLLGILKQALRFLSVHDQANCLILEVLRVKDVGKPVATKERNLQNHELAALWNFLNGTGQTDSRRRIGKRNMLIMKLILVFGCRTVELRRALKSEFDMVNNIWVVPDFKSKTGHTIRRPIPAAVKPDIQLLIDLYPRTPILVPPETKVDSKTPASGQTLASIAPRINEILCLDSWGAHDLRRTIDTKMAELGVLPHVTEKIIGHKMQGVMAIYNKHDYLADQLIAYELWLKHLDNLSS